MKVVGHPGLTVTSPRGLEASITKWDFIIAGVKLQHIFGYTHRLSVAALAVASKEAGIWVCTLESEPNDETIFDVLLEKAAGIASKHEIHPAMPRTVGRQQHRANV